MPMRGSMRALVAINVINNVGNYRLTGEASWSSPRAYRQKLRRAGGSARKAQAASSAMKRKRPLLQHHATPVTGGIDGHVPDVASARAKLVVVVT